MNHDELVLQGTADIFAGNESYAERYMKGVLYSNDIISLHEFSGMEGFVSSVANKIKQFISWLWKSMKAVFSYLFSPSKLVYQRVEGTAAIDLIDKDYKLKSGSITNVEMQMNLVISNMDRAIAKLVSDIKSLENDKKKVEEITPLTGLVIGSIESYQEKWGSVKQALESELDKVEKATTVKQFGYAFLKFVDIVNDYFLWSIKNGPHHKAEYKSDYSDLNTVDYINETVKKQVEKVDEKDQPTVGAFFVKAMQVGSTYNMSFQYNKKVLTEIMGKISNKSLFDKK